MTGGTTQRDKIKNDDRGRKDGRLADRHKKQGQHRGGQDRGGQDRRVPEREPDNGGQNKRGQDSGEQ